MNESKNIIRDYVPEPTLRRLPWYLAHVSLLNSRGIKHVSSTALAKEINVDASQIAKDLSVLGIKGKTRIGYEVCALEKALLDFLGFGKPHSAVIMGVGSLGAALIADNGLANFGLNIIAGFDVNPDVAGTVISNVPVMLPNQAREVIKRTNAEIGIIAVPAEAAQAVANQLVDAGIHALWNFTPVRLLAHNDVVIVNTSIYAHLAVMYNRLDALKQ